MVNSRYQIVNYMSYTSSVVTCILCHLQHICFSVLQGCWEWGRSRQEVGKRVLVLGWNSFLQLFYYTIFKNYKIPIIYEYIFSLFKFQATHNLNRKLVSCSSHPQPILLFPKVILRYLCLSFQTCFLHSCTYT